MAAEQVGVKNVNIGSATVPTIASPTARQTFVSAAAPRQAKGQQATIGANVPAILAGNGRQTRITLRGQS